VIVVGKLEGVVWPNIDCYCGRPAMHGLKYRGPRSFGEIVDRCFGYPVLNMRIDTAQRYCLATSFRTPPVVGMVVCNGYIKRRRVGLKGSFGQQSL
jgi:hypothetical protein